MRGRRFITVLLLLAGTALHAQVPVERSSFRPTGITTEFFGPYAYPVPDLDEARTSGELRVQIAGDAIPGHLGGRDNKDFTESVNYRFTIPLWTDRVNLVCWGEGHEWWQDTEKTRELRRYDSKYELRNNGVGQIWLGLDMLVLREKKYRPSVVLSANLLSAAGDNYHMARHFDAPGYHFTCSAGKDITFRDSSALRISAAAGFVCWQTDRGAQNDAPLYGVKVSYSRKVFALSAEFAGYTGWEKYHDAPQVVKTRLDFHAGRFSPFIYYAHGLRDWPFDQFRAGLSIDFDILKFR